MQLFDGRFHFGRDLFGMLHGQAGGGDYFAYPHLQRLALDVIGVHGQQVESADERDGHDVGLRLDRKKKCARKKRLHIAIARAAALGKDYQRHATAQAPQRRLDGADRSRRVLLVDADLSGAPEMPADERVGQQFTFENDPELKGQVDLEDWDVERRCMSDRIDTGFGVVDLVPIHPGYFHWRQDRLHDEPRPEACAIVLDAAAAVEERAEQRNRAQNQGVGPDQRVENEIRAETAEPAVAWLERRWPGLRPG